MPALVRLSMSLDQSLNDRIDRMMREGRYASRSELFRELVRRRAVEAEWDGNREALGTITLVYDHDNRTLSRKLTRAQHRHHGNVLAATHVHLDRHLCAEMIMVRGKARQIRELADELGHQKGVLHSALSMSSTGKALRAAGGDAHGHGHAHPHGPRGRKGAHAHP
ncbi:MAG: nickel-responsive transcriptional regulator NikR [Candidatus Brocadiae bacterium]|nr:nickel-responsive transcriptional regulator NikR [Candidatus Brocadiia bacterium]